MNNSNGECNPKRSLDEQTTRFLDNLVDSDDRPTYLCNENKEIVYYNSAFNDFYIRSKEYIHCYSVIFNRDSYCPWCPIDSELSVPNKSSKNITIYNNSDKSWLDVTSSPIELNSQKYFLLRIKNITPIKQLEEDYKFHYEQYKNIFHENLYACANHKIMLDETGNPDDYEFIEVNKKFEQFIGRKSPDIVGKTVTELFPDIKSSHVDWINIYGRVALTGETVQMQEYFEDLDKWFKISSFSPNKGYFIVIFEDITETMQLIENLKLTSDSLELSTVATIWSDDKANIVKANEAAYQLLGYDKNELSKIHLTEVDLQVDKDKCNDIFRTLTQQESLSFDTVYKKKDGSTFDARVMLKYFSFNKKHYVINSFFDLTEQKNLEKELKERKKQLENELEKTSTLFQHVLDNTSASIFIINKNGEYILVNKSGAKLVNEKKEHLIGKKYHNYIDSKAFQEIERTNNIVFETKQPIIVEETFKAPFESKDVVFITAKFPLFDENDSVYAIGVIATDITDIKITQKKLEITQEELLKTNLSLMEANKHKDKFLSNMSHELRTPLNAIIGFTDLLICNYKNQFDQTQNDYLKLIKDSSSHLLSLINDILDLTQISSGKVELDLSEINFIDFIDNLTSLLTPQIEKKHIIFENDIDLSIQTIIADNRKLKQILINLISNALKYTPDNGRVIVRARKYNNHILINVIDNGYGIAREEHDKVFSDFFKSSISEKYAVGGTGIGLVLTKKLVEIHGGEIGFESEQNKGSNFWFTLPIRDKL